MGRSFIKGDRKRCNGPLHKGKYVPLYRFWYHKIGERAGKPFSQCIDCINFRKFGDTDHGLIEYAHVKFIFDELEFRIGKAETTRRLGVSKSFFYKRSTGNYQRIRKVVVARAMKELKKCRQHNEARHRKSIRHGAEQRGRTERVPAKRNDYNGKDVKMREYQISYNKSRLTI